MMQLLTPGSFAVLNPGGRDHKQFFLDGPGEPGIGHAPVNYHAYAACLHGGFFQEIEELPMSCRAVLLLVRKKTAPALRAMKLLQKRGIRVFLALKEAGWHQVADAFGTSAQWRVLMELCAMADGALASTQDLVPLFLAAGARRAEFFPTPYPMEFEHWNFAAPVAERSGIFIGTREFDVASRRHLSALRIACRVAKETGRRVTMLDDGSCPRAVRQDFRADAPFLNFVRAPLPYADYLRLLARHEVVFQMDASRVPGQVAGDACLARVLCIGGDGAIERLAFSETCGFGRADSDLANLLHEVLSRPAIREQYEREAIDRADASLSFQSVAPRLADYFQAEHPAVGRM